MGDEPASDQQSSGTVSGATGKGSNQPANTPSAPPGLSPDEAAKAAALIQRNYRGYRERRQLGGRGVDAASKRWAKVAKEAKWHDSVHTRPQPRQKLLNNASTEQRRKDSQDPNKPSFARQEWKRLAAISRQAGNDDPSESDSDGDPNDPTAAKRRAERAKKRREQQENAKMMGLQYFLELVDDKHRYGSHLRSYHAEWMKADTNENFFYWLDHGDGLNVEAPTCSREILDRDQVRYLGREERQKYLVKIDGQGRLRWAKNDEPVTTNYEYRDSLEGIVPSDGKTPTWREDVNGVRPQQSEGAGSSSPSMNSSDGEEAAKEGQHYVNRDIESAKGIKKVQHVSAAAVLNHLLQSTTKKNTWIFAADKSYRLYVGIKQSGAFQHSSFLHGGRLAAAGLIKVKNGQLRSLSPLSGHYRPPTRNFRALVHHLEHSGVDMSRVSISKSYAVLLGLEGYIKTKSTAKDGVHKATVKAEKMFDPAAAEKREREKADTSESAAREREHLARLAAEEQKRKGEQSLFTRLRRRFSISPRPGKAKDKG